MSSQIFVYYAKSNPSYIKAIDTEPNEDGTHTVWHGHKDSRLHSFNLANMSFEEWIMEQLGKGYCSVEAELDRESSRVSIAVFKSNLSPIPVNLWFRRTGDIPLAFLRAAIDSIHSQLAVNNPTDADRLFYLPVTRALYNGAENGGAEYCEGPLALLLLFALRRHFREPGEVAGSPEMYPYFQVSDDSNNLLPDDFDDLGAYIMEMCEAWLTEIGKIEDGASLEKGDSAVLEAAASFGVSHYTSVKSIEKIATVMGCIDPRIDLSATPTKVENAFF